MIIRKQILDEVRGNKRLSPLTHGRRISIIKRQEVFDAIFETIGNFLEAGRSVQITGFGNFKVLEVQGRLRRNRNGEQILFGRRLKIQFRLCAKRLQRMKK